MKKIQMKLMVILNGPVIHYSDLLNEFFEFF